MDDLRHIFTSENPTTWVFTGDSVTQGMRYLYGSRGYVELFAERLRGELGRHEDAVINTAVGGRDLATIRARIQHSALRFAPDVVIVGTGLNDCAKGLRGRESFVMDYHDVLRSIRSAGAVPVIQTPNAALVTSPPYVSDHLQAYTTTIRAIATDLGVPLIDHAAVWECAATHGLVEEWMGQGCHPNAYGHRVMALTLYEAFGILDPLAQTGQLFVPGWSGIPELLKAARSR